MKVNDKIRTEYEKYRREHDREPLYACVVIRYSGEEEESTDVIKLVCPDDTESDPDDNYVVFYVDGLEGLLQINDCFIADFQITDINYFDWTLW